MNEANMTNDKSKMANLEENYGKNILPLSKFENDYLPGKNPTEILIFYKKDTSSSKGIECFLKTAEHYNLFSSRLIMIGENKFALQYCTDGIVTNVLPSINAHFDDVSIDDFRKMMTHVKTLPGEPLVALTVIPVKDGKFVGFSCSHAVADGTSCILFLYAWNCVIEGKAIMPPSRQRLFQGNPVSSDKIDKAFIPPLSALSDEIQNRSNLSNVKTYTTKEYFADEFLREIKRKAKKENAKYVISDNQIMNSFLLKKYHNNILPDVEKIRLRIPVNLRDVHPDIDSMYIGNAFFTSLVEFTKDEIDKLSIYEIAYRLKESIAVTRSENYVKEISSLSKHGIEFKSEIFKNRPAYNIDTDILSSNLTHLNDLESLFLGQDAMSIVNISSTALTIFCMLKEKNGRIFAEITSRYPFK
jgi:hypothetical protein